jgi:hypothetical protein
MRLFFGATTENANKDSGECISKILKISTPAKFPACNILMASSKFDLTATAKEIQHKNEGGFSANSCKWLYL